MKRLLLLLILLISISTANAEISVDKSQIKMQTEDGAPLSTIIAITNTGSETEDLSFSVNSLEDIAELDKLLVSLPSGESVDLTLSFSKSPLGVHVGSVIISTSSSSTEIPVVLESESSTAAYDMVLIASEYVAGEPLSVEIRPVDLTGKGLLNIISYDYKLKNTDGLIIFEQSGTHGAERFTKSLTFPQLPEGYYVLSITSIYEGSLATSSHTFFAQSGKTTSTAGFGFGLLGVLFLVVFAFGGLTFMVLKELKFHRRQHELVLTQRAGNVENVIKSDLIDMSKRARSRGKKLGSLAGRAIRIGKKPSLSKPISRVNVKNVMPKYVNKEDYAHLLRTAKYLQEVAYRMENHLRASHLDRNPEVAKQMAELSALSHYLSALIGQGTHERRP